MRKDGSLPIKLVEPVGENSPVFRFARKGGGCHYHCFKCDNVATEVGNMEDLGLRILARPQAGEAFAEENIAFIFAKQGLNVELIDADLRACILSDECSE